LARSPFDEPTVERLLAHVEAANGHRRATAWRWSSSRIAPG